MTANEIVLQHLDKGLLTITMNRPERRNALSPDMTRGLVEAARRAAEDHEVRAVLLKGAGGTFCVGGDVKSMAEGRAALPYEAKMATLRSRMEVSRMLHERPKPTIAMVNGYCFGGAFSIVEGCDLATAADSATFGLSEINFKGFPGGSVSKTLANLFRPRDALLYGMTGRRFELLPQPCDVNIYSSRSDERLVRPHTRQQSLARKYLPTMIDQLTK